MSGQKNAMAVTRYTPLRWLHDAPANEWSFSHLLFDAAKEIHGIGGEHATVLLRTLGPIVMNHADAELLADIEKASRRAVTRRLERRYEARRQHPWGPNVIDMLGALKAIVAKAERGGAA